VWAGWLLLTDRFEQDRGVLFVWAFWAGGGGVVRCGVDVYHTYLIHTYIQNM
jgi:hypothetical protein